MVTYEFHELRGDDSTDDLRRYQECAKKLDECSKNLLRLCQVSGELTNLHDDDIERAANEIMRTEEEEAKKIAAELLHQKGVLTRNIQQQEPEGSTPSYLNQDGRSGGVEKSNSAAASGRPTDYEVPKTFRNQHDRSLREHSHQQVINQPPYMIVHNEERVPCTTYPGHQYSNSGSTRPNPCIDASSPQGKPNAHSSPYDMKLQGDGSDRRPPFFRKAQQQPPQSTWGRPEPVWNAPVSRNASKITGSSNPRLLEMCNEHVRKMDETAASPSAESANRGKPQTIRLTAGGGRSSEPPVHIVITAITNDCQATIDNGPHQAQAYPREPVFSDNEFAEDSAYSFGNKGTPTGDDRSPRYTRFQQKLVDRGSDAFACPDEATPSNNTRPTYKEILDTILSQRPHDAESLLKSKGILNCALKCWEKSKNNLRSKCPPQTNSCRDLPRQTTYVCQEQLPSQTTYVCQEQLPNQTQGFGLNFAPLNGSTECDQLLQNLSYTQSSTVAPTPCGSSGKQRGAKHAGGMGTENRDVPRSPGTQRTALLKCCQVSAEAKRKQVVGNRCDGVQRQSKPAPCCSADVGDALRQYRTPTAISPCLDRKAQYGQQPGQSQFVTNPRQFEVNRTHGVSQQNYYAKSSQPCSEQYQTEESSQPRGQQYQCSELHQPRVQQSNRATNTYQCTPICPPTQNTITLQCAPSSTLNRNRSTSKMKTTASEMDSSILLAIAKAAINLSLENQQGECEDGEEYEEDCDSEYDDLLDTIFEE